MKEKNCLLLSTLWRILWVIGLIIIPINSQKLYLNIVTIHNPHKLSSKLIPWDINYDMKLYDCYLQFVGYIDIDIVNEIYWLSGNSTLIMENNLNNNFPINVECKYVTVTGVEANHQQVTTNSYLLCN